MSRRRPAYVHQWTQEQRIWLRARAHLPRKALAELFRQFWKVPVSDAAVKGYCKKNAILTGRSGCFEPGHVPDPRSLRKPGETNAGTFKKGSIPHNHKPVGTRTIDSDGYHKVKVAEPNKWAFCHLLLWEEHHGPVPKGHVIRFKDGDKGHIEIDNLVMLTNAEHALATRRRVTELPAELRDTGFATVRLEHAVFRRQRQLKSK